MHAGHIYVYCNLKVEVLFVHYLGVQCIRLPASEQELPTHYQNTVSATTRGLAKEEVTQFLINIKIHDIIIQFSSTLSSTCWAVFHATQ